MTTIQCVKIEQEGMPFIIGEFCFISDLIELSVGPTNYIDPETSITVTFPRMTREELDAIPEYEG